MYYGPGGGTSRPTNAMGQPIDPVTGLPLPGAVGVQPIGTTAPATYAGAMSPAQAARWSAPTSFKAPGFDFGIGGGLGAGGAGGGMGGTLGWVNAGISGVQALGGLYMGMEHLGLAKKQAKLTEEAWRNNVQNAALAGNRDLEDRTLARQAVYAGSPNQMSSAQAQAYLDKNKFILPPSAQMRGRG